MGLLGVVDVQTVLPQQADLKGDLPNLIQRFPGKKPHGVQQIEDRIHPRSASLQFPHGDLPQPVPGQGSQLLRGRHIQHHLEVLLGRLDVSHLHIGEGETVHRLGVLWICLVGLAQEVECPQAVALSSQDGAQVLEGHRVLGIYGQGTYDILLGLGEVALLLVGHAQGHAGVGVLGRELEAAVKQFYAPVEQVEVHIAEAQVVEKIGIIWILMEELLQVDASFVQTAGGEKLEGTGEVVLVGHGEISPDADVQLLDSSFKASGDSIMDDVSHFLFFCINASLP